MAGARMSGMSQPSFAAHGAVDLAALAAQRAAEERARERAEELARSGGADGAEPAPLVIIDVTEETFQAEVVDRSMTVPVVLDFWATWCQPCTQLSPILERLAEADGGRWVLARIDVDANQRLAAAAGGRGIPAAKAGGAGLSGGEGGGGGPDHRGVNRGGPRAAASPVAGRAAAARRAGVAAGPGG